MLEFAELFNTLLPLSSDETLKIIRHIHIIAPTHTQSDTIYSPERKKPDKLNKWFVFGRLWERIFSQLTILSEGFRVLFLFVLIGRRSFFFMSFAGQSRAMSSSFLRFFLDHTQRHTTVGRIPLDGWSARRRDLYLTTHNTHNRQTSMLPVGFEPAIPAFERPQTTLDRAANWDRQTPKYCMNIKQ